MPISRRALLAAAPALSMLGACANDLTAYRDRSITGLAAELGVCSAAYVTLKGGSPQAPVVISGCRVDAPAGPERIFQAASLTKPVVAFGALRLALAGALDLESPVSRYLPGGYRHFHSVLARSPGDAQDRVDAGALATVRVAALLNHTAGLPNWASGTLAFEAVPGERWGYSGEGYVLLQAVIEAVVGTGLAAHFDEHVFGPLGMTDSRLTWNAALDARAPAADAGLWPARPVRFLEPVAAASLYTTASDYARFLAAVLADERLVASTLARPVPVDRALGLEWGHGWGIERSESGPMLWQWGNNPGFRNFAMVSPASKDGFVLLTASNRGMPLAVPLAGQVLPGTHNAFRFSWVA